MCLTQVTWPCLLFDVRMEELVNIVEKTVHEDSEILIWSWRKTRLTLRNGLIGCDEPTDLHWYIIHTSAHLLSLVLSRRTKPENILEWWQYRNKNWEYGRSFFLFAVAYFLLWSTISLSERYFRYDIKSGKMNEKIKTVLPAKEWRLRTVI